MVSCGLSYRAEAVELPQLLERRRLAIRERGRADDERETLRPRDGYVETITVEHRI